MPVVVAGRAAEPVAPAGRCSGQRERFVTGPGPEAGGSNHGKTGCVHVPEKSGTETPLAGNSTVCPIAGIAAATVTKRRKFQRSAIGSYSLHARCRSWTSRGG